MNDETLTLDSPPTPADQSGPGEQKERLRDRVLGTRAVVAVSLASLILGGAGGLALGAISNDADGSTGLGGRGGPGGNVEPGRLPGGPQQGTAP